MTNVRVLHSHYLFIILFLVNFLFKIVHPFSTTYPPVSQTYKQRSHLLAKISNTSAHSSSFLESLSQDVVEMRHSITNPTWFSDQLISSSPVLDQFLTVSHVLLSDQGHTPRTQQSLRHTLSLSWVIPALAPSQTPSVLRQCGRKLSCHWQTELFFTNNWSRQT